MEKAADPAQEDKKRLWADHQSLGRTGKIPVCVWYEHIPEPQWRYMLGNSRPRTSSEVARLIERDLRKRLRMAEHVPDDHILWPTIVVPAVPASEVSWGVSFRMAGTDDTVEDPLEARKMVPAFPDGIRPPEIRFSDLEVDQEATLRRVEEARELTGDGLSVAVIHPESLTFDWNQWWTNYLQNKIGRWYHQPRRLTEMNASLKQAGVAGGASEGSLRTGKLRRGAALGHLLLRLQQEPGKSSAGVQLGLYPGVLPGLQGSAGLCFPAEAGAERQGLAGVLFL